MGNNRHSTLCSLTLFRNRQRKKKYRKGGERRAGGGNRTLDIRKIRCRGGGTTSPHTTRSQQGGKGDRKMGGRRLSVWISFPETKRREFRGKKKKEGEEGNHDPGYSIMGRHWKALELSSYSLDSSTGEGFLGEKGKNEGGGSLCFLLSGTRMIA